MATRRDDIRNFSIIAHIDHGKSTLADRILENTETVARRDMEEQLLDNMDIERERGITIKARAVNLRYHAKDGKDYIFNLIDTPGHVDFNYEVSRSLAACEGAVLVVDASQGIEAQTLANTYLALEHDLEIVPVINKIDLPAADPERVAHEIEDVIGIPALDAPRISAKTGLNVEEVLERIVTDIPGPLDTSAEPLRALIFDSYYDSYRGVIVYIRLVDGKVKAGDRIRMMATGAEFTVVEVGHMGATSMIPCGELRSGEVGYLTASIKSVADTRVGDTVTLASAPAAEPLPGYRKVNPMVFSGIYPVDGAKYPDLRDALEKLQLNDAALSYEPETSIALGFGFRCGFLGLLHMEIIGAPEAGIQPRPHHHRPQRCLQDPPHRWHRPGDRQPHQLPRPLHHRLGRGTHGQGQHLHPCPVHRQHHGAVSGAPGEYIDTKYLDTDRVELHYRLPLNEIIYDFFDSLKSRTRGYASFDYELIGYQASKLVKLDILLNGETWTPLSFIIHADKAYPRARAMVEKLKEHIPRQMFEIPIQAAIGSKVIARETVKALRKDVLAKCYGGDITRKKKLLEKQKEGKKRMRQFGSVEVPQEAFMAVLKLDS